jgi:hypothetical protein
LRPARTLKGSRAARAAIAVLGAWHTLALTLFAVCLYASASALAGGDAQALDLLPAAFAALVLLTLRPRGHGFVAPGPRLIRGEQPALFASLDDATAAVGVDPFDEVYVDGSARAAVIERDGAFGFGGRRTLVVGSALLQTMNVDHLKALVAHEGARYYGADKLAAFVERTRARMRRGLDELAGANGGLTSLPFALCANFFLRATATLSYEHRLATDDRVGEALGGHQLAEVLRISVGMPAVLDAYGKVYAGFSGPRLEDFLMTEEATRVLAFERFRHAEAASANAAEPTLDQRLVRLDAHARESGSFDERPAGSLVSGFETLARRMAADRFAQR